MRRMWIGVTAMGAALAAAGCQSASRGPEYGRLPYPGKVYPPAEAPEYQPMPSNGGAAGAMGTQPMSPEIGPEGAWANPAATQPSAVAEGEIGTQPAAPAYPLYPDYTTPYYTPGYGSPEPQPVPMYQGAPEPPSYISPYDSLWDYGGGWVSPAYPYVPYWDARGHGWDGDHHDHGHDWDHGHDGDHGHDWDHNGGHWEDRHDGGGQVYRVPPEQRRNLPMGVPPIAGHPAQPGMIPAAPSPGVEVHPMSPGLVQPRGMGHPGAVGMHEPAPVPMRPAFSAPREMGHPGGGGGRGGGGRGPAPMPRVINEPHSINSPPPVVHAGGGGEGAGRPGGGEGPRNDAGGGAAGGGPGGRAHR